MDSASFFQHASILASYLQRYSTNDARQLCLCLKNKDNPCGWSITVLGRTRWTCDRLCSLWTQLLTFTKVETHSAGPRGHEPCYSCFCLGGSVSSISTRRQGHPHHDAPSISSLLHTSHLSPSIRTGHRRTEAGEDTAEEDMQASKVVWQTWHCMILVSLSKIHAILCHFMNRNRREMDEGQRENGGKELGGEEGGVRV